MPYCVEVLQTPLLLSKGEMDFWSKGLVKGAKNWLMGFAAVLFTSLSDTLSLRSENKGIKRCENTSLWKVLCKSYVTNLSSNVELLLTSLFSAQPHRLIVHTFCDSPFLDEGWYDSGTCMGLYRNLSQTWGNKVVFRQQSYSYVTIFSVDRIPE